MRSVQLSLALWDTVLLLVLSFSAVPIGECRPPSHTGTLVHSRRHPALSEIGLKMNKGEA